MQEQYKSFGKRWKKCWNVAPDVYLLLRESRSLDSARHKIMNYLNSSESAFRNDYFELSNADFILFKHALIVLKNVFTRRYERMVNNSPLEHLWKASKNGDCDVTDDFIDEFEHLFRGIKGITRVYPSFLMEGIVTPDFEKYKGRDAAIKRSDFLDLLGKKVDAYLEKYPDALEEELVAQREKNKKRILSVMNASEKDWDDYRWHFKNVFKNIKSLEILKKIISIPREQEKAIKLMIENGIPFGVTPFYLHLMDQEPSDFDYAVRKQVFPTPDYVSTMIAHKTERSIRFDFMREHDTAPVDYLTRRYAKVAIIKPYESCAQICIYCQRNWEITSPFGKTAKVAEKDIDRAIKWLSKHEQIMDLLITGGDPLIMSNNLIDNFLSRLAVLPHLKSIRIATRIPITVPQRINDELIDILAKYNQSDRLTIYLVTHFSHSYEMNQQTAEVISRLRKNGILSYNQQVFTFSNSRRFESVALRIALKKIGIDPYYVFNMKGKSEIVDYAVPVARILQERKEEARLLPGIYRLDEPVFNVPFLGKNHMRSWQDHELISILPDGRRIYAFHPWEKNIRKVDSYLYTDVSIKQYLERLRERGEDSEDYQSIWYYY